jgi:hypothetical protein
MFVANIRAKMSELGMTAKDVANSMVNSGYISSSKELYRLVESWVGEKKAYEPKAENACALARALQTTVEELVNGQAGADYIHKLYKEKGALWEPPQRIADIVEVLQALDDATLETVKTMILPLQEKKDSERKAG